MHVVVTGGAGYIGSHVLHVLREAGHTATVIDDLSSGHREALGGAELVEGDVLVPGLIDEVVRRSGAQAILHFAARIQVGESVRRPDLYYATNVGGALAVARAAFDHRLAVVFSSTAAVYGTPDVVPIPVDHPCRPENPYGASKRMAEQLLHESAAAGGFPLAVLRYFNAAGAAPELGLVEDHHPETHLIPLAIDAATGHGPALSLFGDDWPTPDGTCLRDYVHVLDLADAHLLALEALARRSDRLTLNLGGGEGTSVRQILEAVGRAVGRPVPYAVSPRRPGDVAVLVAETRAAGEALGWQPTRSSVDRIVRDAVAARRLVQRR
jgi:UDP-glucose-4-epimerase GalE